MAVKENSFRATRPKPRKKKKSIPTIDFPNPIELVQSRQLQITLGLLCLAGSLFIGFSLLSFISTGEADQSLMFADGIGFEEIRENGVQNWFGLTGATVSHWLIFETFGLASTLIAPALFFLGLQFLKEERIIRLKEISSGLFALLWISLLFGYLAVISDTYSIWPFLCGRIGFNLAMVLDLVMGWGTLVFLACTAALFFVYFFGFDPYPSFRVTTSGNQTVQTTPKTKAPKAKPVSQDLEDEETIKDELEISEPEPKQAVSSKPEKKIASTFIPKDDDQIESLDEVWARTVEKNQVDPRVPPSMPEITPTSDNQKVVETSTLDTKTEPASDVDTTKEIDPVNEKKEEVELEVLVDHTDDPEIPDTPELEVIDEMEEDQVQFEVSTDETEPPAIDKEEFDHKPITRDEKVNLLVEDQEDEPELQDNELYDPKLDLGRYQYPKLELLQPPSEKPQVSPEELNKNKDRIIETLRNFKIGIQKISATIGPTVTLYEIIPDAGIKISKIRSLEDDIALSLSALGIRIIAPIPGKGTIGIEVPNNERETVSMRQCLNHRKFTSSDKALPIVLGKTIKNDVFVTDLAKMPHLLMAGATGQGKSVGLNVIITSLLYKKHPSELKFVMIDPKKVELALFEKIERHFLATLPDAEEAIITDTTKAVGVLNSLCKEMDERYDLLKAGGCRNVKEYNQKFVHRRLNPQKGHKYLPYIVLIIDELADLMMTAGKEVEMPIARLAQLARAIGIHLIIATQRPSVDVITGMIKANFPARLSFKVSSRIDSRTILDTNGADQLIGMGDMLLSNGSEIIRLQCAYVDTPEVDQICDWIGGQQGYPTSYQLPEYEKEEANGKDVDLGARDEYFEAAARLMVQQQSGSTSSIQRKLSLGYNRAGRIMDQLEAANIVGPFEGSKARQVLIHDEYELERVLNTLNGNG
jgi:S-DNA-T family DNA segregation ATPase FtsK/SpoIIIE